MAPRNDEQEKEILEWIGSVLGEPLADEDFATVLKDGIILCRLMNKLQPGSVKRVKEKGPAFMLMENVQAFLSAAKKYGVPDEEVFQTPDLFEKRNIPQVVLCLFSLGRVTQMHPEYAGPMIGPKMATRNERNFSEEQIRQGRDATIGLQAGSNIGASQAGHGGMGNSRHM
eukprot:GFUD01019358.1.p1 GENE.GFUD01019358.1~~GFUD01019358.1.p1  ORF type:complete len:183 (+),score=47.46 GFUD01019358.1:39-551(+)